MSLSTQQQLALDQQKALYLSVREANQRLEDKASTLLQANGFVVGLAIAAQISFGSSVTDSQKYLAVAVLVLFVIMIVLSLFVWLPISKKALPGTLDWDDIYYDIVKADETGAYRLVIANLLNATIRERKRNKHRWMLVVFAGICFGLQIIILFIALLIV
ncbi:MAG: hypothetical protein M9928_00245 [Anaerolineae bacterium]|nr:hypothetical protein [Anaerolineae bacterium]MCO5192438.1 hypothetical protein [Anaerolineae bacterium]MCO5203440.1 hypothetical protein [Anaerolineae bacterium]